MSKPKTYEYFSSRIDSGADRIQAIQELIKGKDDEEVYQQLEAILYFLEKGLSNNSQLDYDIGLPALSIDEVEDMFHKPLRWVNKLLKELKGTSTDSGPIKKLTWNGDTIALVQVFKTLKSRTNEKKQPLLDATYDELEEFICSCFLDKTGKPLKPSTIRGYLRDSSKEPQKGRNQINLDDLT